MKKFVRLALSSFALLAFGISSCGETPAPSDVDYSHNNRLVESVTLSEDYLTCSIGDSFELLAEIKFKDDEKVDISKRWASSKTSVARITPDYENDTCFVEVVGSGTTQISIIAGYRSAICEIYVPATDPTPGPGPGPDPQPGTTTTITLSTNSRTLSVGESFNLTATVSPLADATFDAGNTTVIEITESTSTACVVKAKTKGEADVLVTAGDASIKCHVIVLDSQEEGDKDYTVYFFIDYNNADTKDTTGKKLLAKFDWYYDRPLIEAKDAQGNSLIPTVADTQAMDPAFPYFIGWSTHPIIDTKENLWDMNKDTIADLPMMSYSVSLYGQWFDVPVLPA